VAVKLFLYLLHGVLQMNNFLFSFFHKSFLLLKVFNDWEMRNENQFRD
jgi:hypothetical protein